MKRGKQLFGVGLILILFLAFYLRLLQQHPELGLAGLALLVVAYLTGLMAFAVGILYSIWTYVVALPLISSLYALLLSLIVLVERIVYGKIIGTLLNKIPQLKKAEMKIRNSRPAKAIDGILKKAGVKKPYKMALIKVKECPECKKDIPADGRTCPYCSVKLKKARGFST